MLIMMLEYIFSDAMEKAVRTTVTIDDELFQRALEAADPGAATSSAPAVSTTTLYFIVVAPAFSSGAGACDSVQRQ
jgi:hypothetical protein